MTRRIAFYLPRSNHLRISAPIIQHLCRHQSHRYEVAILYPAWPIGKRALQVEPDKLAALFGAHVSVHALSSPELLEETILRQHLEAVVSTTTEVAEIEPQLLRQIMARTRQAGVKWLTLPYTFHQERLAITQPASLLASWDVVCVPSRRSIDFIEGQLRRQAPALVQPVTSRLAVIGYPELDGIHTLDRAAILKKYALPTDRPIVYVSTAANFSLQGGWTSRHAGYEQRFRGRRESSASGVVSRLLSYRTPVVIPYRQYLARLRELADRTGACLIAKTRAKHQDPAYVQEYCDRVFDDVTYVPFTTLELLSVSNLYVGFSSLSVLESITLGVRSFTLVSMPLGVLFSSPFDRACADAFLVGAGGLWNTPGVSEWIDGTARSGYAALERLARLPSSDWRIDPVGQQRLLDAFLPSIGRSAEAFCDVLSRLWEAKDGGVGATASVDATAEGMLR